MYDVCKCKYVVVTVNKRLWVLTISGVCEVLSRCSKGVGGSAILRGAGARVEMDPPKKYTAN